MAYLRTDDIAAYAGSSINQEHQSGVAIGGGSHNGAAVPSLGGLGKSADDLPRTPWPFVKRCDTKSIDFKAAADIPLAPSP